jgi:hypothetical protein
MMGWPGRSKLAMPSRPSLGHRPGVSRDQFPLSYPNAHSATDCDAGHQCSSIYSLPTYKSSFVVLYFDHVHKVSQQVTKWYNHLQFPPCIAAIQRLELN